MDLFREEAFPRVGAISEGEPGNTEWLVFMGWVIS